MKYYAITLDPLHIGAGGYRLGRVDNTIIRDAGSDLPKIPGSSLAGIARSYAAMQAEASDQDAVKNCQNNFKGNCGGCIICKAFGYASDEKNKNSHIGLLHFSDAHIVAFPVRTLMGPVWVTSPTALVRVGITLDKANTPKEDSLCVNFDLLTSTADNRTRLNLGWLYLPAVKMKSCAELDPLRGQLGRITATPRIAIAPDWLFAEVVNSNLAVRTSVSIDPATGAAKTGALFTYEAIPAAALLALDVDADAWRCEQQNHFLPEELEDMVEKAFRICAVLGMGGMSTRGFGRMDIKKEA